MALTLLLVPLVCHLLLALLLIWNRSRTPVLDREARSAAVIDRDPAPDPATLPSVLCLVPARNEEPNIEACVLSLLSQRYPNFSVLVIDDHSTDRTAAVVSAIAARDPRLRLLSAPDLPPGWLGKPHALFAGTQDPAAATADYLLFIDADLRLTPDALPRAIATARRTGAGLLTVVPQLLAESIWERAVQPVVATLLFGLLVDPVKVADPKSSRASANGPFLLFRRDAYQRLGGHRAVATEVVEDLRLAQLTKAAGLPLSYCNGTDVARLRMYDSLRGILNGWGKNCHVALGGARAALLLAPVSAAILVWVLAGPTLAIWGGLISFLLGCKLQGALALTALCSYVADWVCRLSLRWNYRVSPRGSRALGGALLAYILVAAAYRIAAKKPVSWRGRALHSAP